MTKPDWVTVVRTLRYELAMTQEGFARYLGVSFATVNRWEHGTTPQRAAQEVLTSLAKKIHAEWAFRVDRAEAARKILCRRATNKQD